MWPCYILQYSFPVSCVSDKRAPIIFYDTVSLQVVSVTNVHLLYSTIQSHCKLCQWNVHLLYSITQSIPASSVSDERAPVIFHITVSLQVVSVTNVHLLYSTTQSPCKLCQWRTCSCYILQYSLTASCVSNERVPVIFYNTVSLQVVSAVVLPISVGIVE